MKGKESDLRFGRNDLQIVEGEPNKVPKMIRVITRKIAADNELSKGAFMLLGKKVVKAATTTAAPRRSKRGKMTFV